MGEVSELPFIAPWPIFETRRNRRRVSREMVASVADVANEMQVALLSLKSAIDEVSSPSDPLRRDFVCAAAACETTMREDDFDNFDAMWLQLTGFVSATRLPVLQASNLLLPGLSVGQMVQYAKVHTELVHLLERNDDLARHSSFFS